VLVNRSQHLQFRGFAIAEDEGSFCSESVWVAVGLLDNPTMCDSVSGVVRVGKLETVRELRRPSKSQVDLCLWVGCSTGKLVLLSPLSRV
jgi:hypothetical protein